MEKREGSSRCSGLTCGSQEQQSDQGPETAPTQGRGRSGSLHGQRGWRPSQMAVSREVRAVLVGTGRRGCGVEGSLQVAPGFILGGGMLLDQSPEA